MPDKKNLFFILSPWSGDVADKRKLRHYNMVYTLEQEYGFASTLYVEDAGKSVREKTLSDLEDSKIIYSPAIGVKSKRFKKAVRGINMLLFIVYGLFRIPFKSDFRKSSYVWGSVPHPGSALVGLFLSKVFRKKFIYEIRDPWPELLISLDIIDKKSIIARALKYLDFLFQKHAINIITINDARYFIKPKYHSKIVKYENSIPSYMIREKDRSAKKVGRPIRFIYAGGCANAFKMDLILGAFQLLMNDNKFSFTFQVYTAAAESEDYRKTVDEMGLSEYVTFNDFIPYEKLKNEINKSDFYVFHLTDNELFRYGINSNKILDAFMFNIPMVMAANIPNNYVRESKGGFWTLPDNIEFLYGALRDACSVTDEEYAILRKNVRSFAMNNLLSTVKISDFLSDIKVDIDG